MDATIRLATADDIDCLISLIIGFRDLGDDKFPTEDSLRRDLPRLIADDNAEFFLAVSPGGESLGFLQQRYRFTLWLSGPEAYIEDLFVVEQARRMGIGRRLVELAVDRATARGCPLMSLDTTERNEQAIRLYERLDFSLRSPRGLRLLLRRWLGAGPAPWQQPRP